MKNLKTFTGLVVVLFASFVFTACSDESEDNNENLVQNVEIKEIGKVLNPNDLVHITGRGFELSDQILMNFYWETGDRLLPEGSFRDYYTEITEINENAITIKLPYRMPASRVEVMLVREGNMQKLGEVKMADGQTPKEYRLYGIYNNSTLDFSLDMPEQIVTILSSESLTKWQIEEHPDFHSVVNVRLTYGLCGLANDNGTQKPYFFDFCTGRWKKLSQQSTLAIASVYGENAVSIEDVGGNRYSIGAISSDLLQSNFLTRSYSIPNPQRTFELPADLKPEYFGQYPAIQIGNNTGNFLLSANKGDNKWVPVGFSVTGGFVALDEIEADALIPFCFYIQENNETVPMSGYIISSERNGSQFCLVNKDNFALEEPFTKYPNKALSVTPANLNTFIVHFRAYRNGNITSSFDYTTKEWRLTSFGGCFDEIIWAN